MAGARVLTVQAVERMKPDPTKRQEVADAVTPGLYLIVQPSGAKSWALRYRHAGKPRKLTLGAYPGLCHANWSAVSKVPDGRLGQAAAVAICQACAASALKVRRVRREIRWR